MTQADLRYSQFKSLVVSLVSDCILKIKNFDKRKRNDYYTDLRVFLEKVCKFTSADDVEDSYAIFCSILEEVSVSAPELDDFGSILCRSTPNEHHEWRTGAMRGVVVEQVRTRLGDEFPSDLSL
jgi:hypothetical protein